MLRKIGQHSPNRVEILSDYLVAKYNAPAGTSSGRIMATSVHVFVDETKENGYMVTAVAILPGNLTQAR